MLNFLVTVFSLCIIYILIKIRRDIIEVNNNINDINNKVNELLNNDMWRDIMS